MVGFQLGPSVGPLLSGSDASGPFSALFFVLGATFRHRHNFFLQCGLHRLEHAHPAPSVAGSPEVGWAKDSPW